MKITILIENTKESENLTAEHGLGVLIETEKNCILVDTGQTDAIIGNSEKLGVDLKKVNICVLSHGHYDHCGGVLTFRNINPDADIYISENAFGDFRNSTVKYIGINPDIKNINNLHLTNGNTDINDELSLFGNVKGKKLYPFGNKKLQAVENGKIREDDFRHEQYAVISENGKKVLVSGCAHRGIVNIVEEFVSLYGRAPDAVISGFHLMKDSDYSDDEIVMIKETAEALGKYETVYYSGHCTGNALPILKDILNDKFIPIHTGFKFKI